MLAEMSTWQWVTIVLLVLAVLALVALYFLSKFSMLPRFGSGPDREPPLDPKAGVSGQSRDQTHRRYPAPPNRENDLS